MVKPGYKGTYHHMSPNRLDRHVSGYAGRHNLLLFGTLPEMSAVARGMDERIAALEDADHLAPHNGGRGSHPKYAITPLEGNPRRGFFCSGLPGVAARQRG